MQITENVILISSLNVLGLISKSLSDWSNFTSRIEQELKKDPHKNYTKRYSDEDYFLVECARPN